MDKLGALKEILSLDANNSFARYGIAMELVSQGKPSEAIAEFDTLLASNPEYTAGYFMAAQTLSEQGRTAEAMARLSDGINCAARNGNTHALNEMQALLSDLKKG